MMTTPPERQVAGSFRDPSGFLFTRDGVLYRQVNACYQPHYERLMQSGCYAELTGAGLLIPHEESDARPAIPGTVFKVIRPECVSFISYPYEWCFSQLRDAALTTLDIMRRALRHGLWLKDASAYNIQFHQGRPVLIDTLSFETYPEGDPWVAYRQFCQHFLAPLLLMARQDGRLNLLGRLFIDGIPLDLASRLLPWRSRFALGALLHVHLHAKAIARLGGPRPAAGGQRRMTRFALEALGDSLASTVRRARYAPAGTEWGDYYEKTNYSEGAFAEKQKVVGDWLARVRPGAVWDIGANDGTFSRQASGAGIPTVAFDIDPAAVEKAYRMVRAKRETHLLPLRMDLTNPSPSLGWRNRERESWGNRGQPGLVLALALIHHLAIGNNVPLAEVVALFHDLAPWVIVEFMPKSDSQVQRMLATRADIFPDYTPAGFEAALHPYFEIKARQPVSGSERILYLLQRRVAGR